MKDSFRDPSWGKNNPGDKIVICVCFKTKSVVCYSTTNLLSWSFTDTVFKIKPWSGISLYYRAKKNSAEIDAVFNKTSTIMISNKLSQNWHGVPLTGTLLYILEFLFPSMFCFNFELIMWPVMQVICLILLFDGGRAQCSEDIKTSCTTYYL